MPSKFPLCNLSVVETKRRNLHQLDPYLGLICSTFCCIFLFSSRNGPSGERRIPQLKIIGRMDRTISFSSLLKGLQKQPLIRQSSCLFWNYDSFGHHWIQCCSVLKDKLLFLGRKCSEMFSVEHHWKQCFAVFER